jgi:hypothetical protein
LRRLDTVDEFVHNEEVFFELVRVLSQIGDIDQVTSFLVQMPRVSSIKGAQTRTLTLCEPTARVLGVPNCLATPCVCLIQ